MSAKIDAFDTYYLYGMAQEIRPRQSFFKDRYFGGEKTFTSDKVLFELKNGKRKIALFVDENAGDIASSRGGYELHEIAPSLIAPSRPLTLDDLKKRGFGETLIQGDAKEERARKLQLEDMNDLDEQIGVREEWMAAQCLANYGFEMQEYIDSKTQGKKKVVKFFDGSNPTSYSVGTDYWTTWQKMKAHVKAMCDSLSEGSHAVTDLILGSKVWAAVSQFDALQKELDNRSIDVGQLRAEIVTPGVAYMGRLNFDGYLLNIIVPNETYVDDADNAQKMFNEKSALVIAPNCGETLYGAVTQIPYGETEYATFDGKRVPKLIIDANKDMRKLALKSRPLTVPKAVAPWRYAANVIA